MGYKFTFELYKYLPYSPTNAATFIIIIIDDRWFYISRNLEIKTSCLNRFFSRMKHDNTLVFKIAWFDRLSFVTGRKKPSFYLDMVQNKSNPTIVPASELICFIAPTPMFNGWNIQFVVVQSVVQNALPILRFQVIRASEWHHFWHYFWHHFWHHFWYHFWHHFWYHFWHHCASVIASSPASFCVSPIFLQYSLSSAPIHLANLFYSHRSLPIGL